MPLFIVPTPIGNLEDMTLRGLRILREADVIACEDTRHTLQLLNHFDIKRPLISCHEHNERERTEMFMERLSRGEKIALVSDAGTPGLSDPGAVIARAAAERGFPVDVLPGANALLPALLLSGFSMESFLFIGFLKGTTEEKKKYLASISDIKSTLVFYMAPHRLLKELAFLGEALGDRPAALVREISKIHQETIKGTLLTFCDTMTEDKIRGEFVCVVSGAEEQIKDDSAWQADVLTMLDAGKSARDTAEIICAKHGIQKNAVKKFINIRRNADE